MMYKVIDMEYIYEYRRYKNARIKVIMPKEKDDDALKQILEKMYEIESKYYAD